MQNGTAGREEAGSARALVALTAQEALSRGARPRPQAAFVAQLLACRQGLDLFRRCRRESPAAAATAYGRAQRGLPNLGRLTLVL